MESLTGLGQGTTLLIGISPELAEVGRMIGSSGERIGIMSRDAERLQEYRRWYEDHQIDCEVFPADVTNPESVLTAFLDLAKWSRQLDRIIYNVGVASSESALDVTQSELHRVMQSNFFGFVNCFQLALPMFQRSGGGQAIILSGSITTPNEEPAGIAYTTSKSSLQIYTAALRKELAGSHVHFSEMVVGWKSAGTGWGPMEISEIAEGVLYCLTAHPHHYQIGISRWGLTDF
jgi:short-subunit dehydrogenase